MEDSITIIPEMKDLMDEVITLSNFTEDESVMVSKYFNETFDFINSKAYKYGLDDNGFVIRRDCRADKKNIYGWDFIKGVPTALNTKTDIKKISKTDLKNKKSIYFKIYNNDFYV